MSIDITSAIPSNRSVIGWKDVPIVEIADDQLVDLEFLAPERIITHPYYYSDGLAHAINKCYCRAGVAQRLLNAANQLPSGFKFLIWDAWRPVEVQQELFDSYRKQLSRQTGLTGVELEEMVQTYISLPSVDTKKPSPHLTGAAIDLTIVDNNGDELDMGTPFDFFGPEAQTDYYENKQELDSRELSIQKNRRILYNLLINNGFTNYPHEWWHFDYGNQFWAVQTKQAAFYNKIFLVP